MLKNLHQSLTSLPRETRDTLFLLAVIGWVVFLQVGHIPWWCGLLTAGVLAWRTTLTLRGLPLPGWPWRIGLLALLLGATWATHSTILGRDAGVTLIVVLLALKTLEMRAKRDAFVIFFLSFFMLLTHFFYSQTLLTAAGILIALMALLTALVNAHMPVGRPSLGQAARIAGGMALMGAPIMLVLFLLFPRLSPLWGTPGDDAAGRSGLSNSMRVGQIAQLVLDDNIALRVKFEGSPPPQGQLYFRGPVLSDFDGAEWRPVRSGFPDALALPPDLVVSGEAVRYEVTMEANRRPWLFLLGQIADAPAIGTTISADLSQAGWLPQTWTWGGVAGIFGVVVLVRDGSDPATHEAAAALVDALGAAGFNASKGDWPANWGRFRGTLNGPQTPSPTEAAIRIVVGEKARKAP